MEKSSKFKELQGKSFPETLCGKNVDMLKEIFAVEGVDKLCVESGKIGDIFVETQFSFNILFITDFLKYVESFSFCSLKCRFYWIYYSTGFSTVCGKLC